MAQGCGQTEQLENKHPLAKETSRKMGGLIHCVYLMFVCYIILHYNNFHNI